MRKIFVISTVTLTILLSLSTIINLLFVKNIAIATTVQDATNNDENKIKRGTPPYDYIIGKYGLPHYRVFFWVPLNAKDYNPFTNEGVITDVSHHGSVEKWSVAETYTKNREEKLVFIYVPKTFVFLLGMDFYKVIFLNWS